MNWLEIKRGVIWQLLNTSISIIRDHGKYYVCRSVAGNQKEMGWRTTLEAAQAYAESLTK